ncbi:CLUMA_CG015103, isoform A [Clunio marinus]|uniref:Protein unc-45 homolog B n=1 Tax=Clunio marinus TaxID=568069 RepID=A0A1J1IQK9_9DIPT|nr:CLUMA_CG015103, isoform A [Clunio marinus]
MVETIEDPSVYKEKGNEAFKRSEWDKAISFYTKAIKTGEKHKELPVFYKNRAAAYLKTEAYERAHDDCTKSLDLQPNDQKALFRRAQALEALERFEEAYRDARTIWNTDPSFKPIQPILERLHLIVQNRVAQNAQTSTKVSKMFEIAFDVGAEKSKRETAMSNLVVLAREKAGADIMFREGIAARVSKLFKVEKNDGILVSAIRVIDDICTKSLHYTRNIIRELGIPWFLQILDSKNPDRVMAAQHCLQVILNSFSGLVNKEDAKPDQQLVEDNKNEIDTLLTCLLYATTDRTITGEARDAVVELLTRNIHYKTLSWAERLVEINGLPRLLEICSELEEYKYESAMPITPSSRTIASVCLARIYENMYYDEARQKFFAHVEEFVKDKLLNPDFESKVRVAVAITSLLLGPLDIGNQIFAREGIMQMILAMATDDDLLQQKVACECLIAAASKKDKAKALVTMGVDILKKLYHSSDEGIRVRALVGLCKLGSSGGLDASIRPFAEGSTKKLAEACRRFLIKPGKDKDIRKFAAEGLSYLTLDADVKEKLVEDKLAIQALIELAKSGDQSVLYGVVTTLVNLVNAYEKQELLPELVELAKFAKHHVPEEHDLDDADFIAKRVIALADEGVTTALVALCKTESDNSKEMIARVFNAICAEQSVRGKVVQQGGAKVLIPLALKGNEMGRRHAAQALSRLGITINPEQAFPGQRTLEVVRPLLNQLNAEYTALENFEALMAICNLASVNESIRSRLIKEQGMTRIEAFLMEDHMLLTRAAAQVICNMVVSDEYVKYHESDNDRVKFLALLCEEEDEETALACAGALAILTSVSDKCCEKMLTPKAWLEVLHTLIANPSPEVQYRGTVIIHNMIKQSKNVAEKIFETDIMELLMGLTQLNDETRGKAIDMARQCLKTAEDMKLIQEKKGDENEMMPDVFDRDNVVAEDEELDE